MDNKPFVLSPPAKVKTDVVICAGPKSNQIHFVSGDRLAIVIDPTGFWVDGVEVPQDANKAKAVYDAFVDWLPIKP